MGMRKPVHVGGASHLAEWVQGAAAVKKRGTVILGNLKGDFPFPDRVMNRITRIAAMMTPAARSQGPPLALF